jgi:hypothetical protein
VDADMKSMAIVSPVCGGFRRIAVWAALAAIGFGLQACAGEESAAAAGPSHAERMAALGWTRFRGAWRTAQEIELIERAEAANLAEKQWNQRLARLRGQLDQPRAADRAAEELREISDPHAVPAIAAALATEPVFQVRGWYVESLARIRSAAAFQSLVAIALDHPDSETRIVAVERLETIGSEQAMPGLVAGLAGGDPARVNRAAEALGRLGDRSVILPLVSVLEMRQVVTAAGPPPGSTSATFSPTGGSGLSMGGGPTQRVVMVRNERVLEALVALTGVDFGWDAAAWRQWFASERQPPAGFDPRRG